MNKSITLKNINNSSGTKFGNATKTWTSPETLKSFLIGRFRFYILAVFDDYGLELTERVFKLNFSSKSKSYHTLPPRIGSVECMQYSEVDTLQIQVKNTSFYLLWQQRLLQCCCLDV